MSVQYAGWEPPATRVGVPRFNVFVFWVWYWHPMPPGCVVDRGTRLLDCCSEPAIGWVTPLETQTQPPLEQLLSEGH